MLTQLRHQLIPQLNAILGYSEMLRDDARKSGQTELGDRLDRIYRAGRQLLTITNNHLGSSTMGTVRLDFDIERLCRSLSLEMGRPVDEIIESAASLLKSSINPDNEHFIGDLKRIQLVGERLRSSLGELVSVPAAAATPSGTRPEFGLTMSALSIRTEIDRQSIKTGSILVVEGDELNLDLLIKQLERDGHTVAGATNGIEALKEIQARRFDLVLLDLMLKGMNGLAVLDWMKADEEIRDIPVIVLSPLDEVKSLIRCIERGAEDYLSKPVNTTLLRTRINACLEKKRLRDQERELVEQLREDHERQEQLLRELATANWEIAQTMEELKSTQEKLITQEKLASLGALTAGIAHEIKNPLNFVTNFAQLSVELTGELKEELSGLLSDAEQASYINDILEDLRQNSEKINEHGRRADSIVRSMLLLSRGQTGEWQKTDLNALVNEYLNLAYHGMRAQDSSFNIDIVTRYDTSLTPIDAVQQDLGRVLLNIFNNACYAMREKSVRLGESYQPRLMVQTRRNEDHAGISILDNGPGIPKAIVEKIFNPFFTTKPPGEGTGLGLSIGHEIIVKEHNGEIRVNTEEGEFTEFLITLPLVSQ